MTVCDSGLTNTLWYKLTKNGDQTKINFISISEIPETYIFGVFYSSSI